jgi:hypothetical protein
MTRKINSVHNYNLYNTKLCGLLVRKRTIQIERPPPVGEVSANFCGQKLARGERNGSPRQLISDF